MSEYPEIDFPEGSVIATFDLRNILLIPSFYKCLLAVRDQQTNTARVDRLYKESETNTMKDAAELLEELKSRNMILYFIPVDYEADGTYNRYLVGFPDEEVKGRGE